MSFDYKNGEGTRHVALVTRWDGTRYWIIDAQPDYGISEHPLAHPFLARDDQALGRARIDRLTDF